MQEQVSVWKQNGKYRFSSEANRFMFVKEFPSYQAFINDVKLKTFTLEEFVQVQTSKVTGKKSDIFTYTTEEKPWEGCPRIAAFTDQMLTYFEEVE